MVVFLLPAGLFVQQRAGEGGAEVGLQADGNVGLGEQHAKPQSHIDGLVVEAVLAVGLVDVCGLGRMGLAHKVLHHRDKMGPRWIGAWAGGGKALGAGFFEFGMWAAGAAVVPPVVHQGG